MSLFQFRLQIHSGESCRQGETHKQNALQPLGDGFLTQFTRDRFCDFFNRQTMHDLGYSPVAFSDAPLLLDQCDEQVADSAPGPLARFSYARCSQRAFADIGVALCKRDCDRTLPAQNLSLEIATLTADALSPYNPERVNASRDKWTLSSNTGHNEVYIVN